MGSCARSVQGFRSPNHAKFQLDRLRGFGAPGGRKSLSPIDWRYRPYNSVHINVLHCDLEIRGLHQEDHIPIFQTEIPNCHFRVRIPWQWCSLGMGMGTATWDWYEMWIKCSFLQYCAVVVWPTKQTSNCTVNCFFQTITLYIKSWREFSKRGMGIQLKNWWEWEGKWLAVRWKLLHSNWTGWELKTIPVDSYVVANLELGGRSEVLFSSPPFPSSTLPSCLLFPCPQSMPLKSS